MYHEYPKCLYIKGGETLTVDNAEEEDAANKMGWQTAAEFYGYKKERTRKGAGDEDAGDGK